MTVEELYNLCKRHTCEHFEIKVKHREDEGFYEAPDSELWLDINDNDGTIILYYDDSSRIDEGGRK